MLDMLGTRYNVAVDLGGLKLDRAGSQAAGHSVTLIGPVDDQWRQSYRTVRAQSPEFSRFRLDEATATVKFARDAGDSPSEIIGALEELDLLVARVNERASAVTAGDFDRQPVEALILRAPA